MSKFFIVLLLISLLFLLTGCQEKQANLGDDLLLSSQQGQTVFWTQYPENWETEVSHPTMYAQNAK